MRKTKRPRKPEQEGMSKTTRAVLLVVGLVGGSLLVATGVSLPWIIPHFQHETLKGSVPKFLITPAGRDTSTEPYVTGKVVVIDVKARTLDGVQSRLPEEIRAYREDEVGTIVWLDWEFKTTEGDWGRVTGHYSTCQVTIIDRNRNRIVGERQVVGTSSPVSTGGGRGPFRAPPGQQTARRATNEVAGLIARLPRR
jgi:hypothetical protein